MFSKNLTQAGHSKRFSVRAVTPAGWEVCEEVDATVVRKVRYDDWHRVERAVAQFSLEVSRLRRTGWVEAT
jgi:hypothetical protein